MKTIAVNGSGLGSGGALTILRQFIEAVPEDGFQYLVFVREGIEFKYTQSNIKLVRVPYHSSRIKRLFANLSWAKKWLKTNNVKPVATISLQNVNFCIDNNIPNFVYFHNTIPFHPSRWSLFKPSEALLWYYKHIYPMFVSRSLRDNTEVFVQLEFTKDGFAGCFDFPHDRIHVITPKIILPDAASAKPMKLDRDKMNLFYPASPFFYKNHKIILDALSEIKNSNFTLYLTCDKGDIDISCTDSDVRFMGVVPFETVLGMYKDADALLFPSYIESYGLPLIEAASFGIPIIAADLPYSREVLKGYEGVVFADHTNANAWAEAIQKLTKGKRFKPFVPLQTKSWPELFRIVKQNI